MSTRVENEAPPNAASVAGAPTFEYREGRLCCEEVPLERIYRVVGSAYVYSASRLRDNARRVLKAFSRADARIAYPVKANANPALVRLFEDLGLGLEVGTGAELNLALQTGVEPGRLVVNGNGRTDGELRQAASCGAYLVSVDSDEEAMRLEEAAGRLRREGRLAAPVRCAVRVNPGIDPHVHPEIATGLEDAKFGLPADRALEWYRHPDRTPHLEWVGVHVHVGSQMLEVEPLYETLSQLADFVDRARAAGAPLNVINIGGGFGVDYDGKGGFPLERFADAACLVANNLDCSLVVEPGRFLVADSAALVGKVLFVKRTRRSFAVTELAMNDLMRPLLYEAHHEIVPVREPRAGGGHGEVVDVVGPICENADFLARDRRLPVLPAGSLIAVTGAGAYGYAMASNYNGRGRLPEVMVSGSRVRLIRRRESWKDLLQTCTDESLDLAGPSRVPEVPAIPVPAAPEWSRTAATEPDGDGARPAKLGSGIAEGLLRRRKKTGGGRPSAKDAGKLQASRSGPRTSSRRAPAKKKKAAKRGTSKTGAGKSAAPKRRR